MTETELLKAVITDVQHYEREVAKYKGTTKALYDALNLVAERYVRQMSKKHIKELMAVVEQVDKELNK